MQNFKLALIAMLLLALSGCAQHKDSAPNNAAENAKSILPVADSQSLPDVIKALLKKSDEQFLNHNLSGSLATLERAVRINPRYAEVWSRMAQVYLKLDKLEQAKQHAKRSNSVLKNNPDLKNFNNNIIMQNITEPLN